jgi:hypothetical protein
MRFGMSASSRSRRRRAKHRRGASGGDRHQHRVAIDDGGHDEARGFAIVDHVDGNAARFAQAGDPAIHGAARGRDDDEPRAVKIIRDELAK